MGHQSTNQVVRRSWLRRRVAALATLMVAVGASITLARSDSIDGQSIGGVPLGAPVQRGGRGSERNIDMSARRAWTWKVGGTTRVILEEDVRVRIAGSTFDADRAALWIEPSSDDAGVKQVAAFFTNVRHRGAAAVTGQGQRLLVTAALESPDIDLRTDLLRHERPDTKFVNAAEARLAAHLASLGAQGVSVTSPEQVPRATDPAGGEPAQGNEVLTGDDPAPEVAPMARPITAPFALPEDPRTSVPASEGATIAPPQSRVVTFSGEARTLDAQADGSQIALLTPSHERESVIIQYGAPDDLDGMGGWKVVELRAQNAVVFLKRAPEESPFRYDLEDIRGVYLEGDVVATDGSYTVRGSRMYYDLASNKGVLIDGVFWTFDEQRGMPIYMRAQAIQQTAQNEWRAHDATLANIDLADPHFSIGAESITIRRVPRVDQGVASFPGVPGDPEALASRDRVVVDASNVGFRTGSVALLGTPGFKGEVRPAPIRSVQFDSVDGDPVIRTRWDAGAILGLDLPEGNRFDLLLDGYFARGPAIGTDLEWRSRDIAGSLLSYFIYDNGRDHLSSGAEIDRDDDARGMIAADNVWRLNTLWTTFAELSYISDPAFVDAFFESEAETRREFISALRARRLDAHTAFNIGVRGTLNDFIANEYLLQNRGYVVEKLPEARYSVVGLDTLGGLLSYSSETTLSSMDLQFHEPALRESGFDTIRRARAGFGLLPSTQLADVLRSAGYPESTTNRFDTRHQFELPLRAGPDGVFNLTPFVAGRFTAYDDDFDDFSGVDDDPYRLWYSGGVRAATSVVGVDDNARSEWLDVNRVRHIIEPSATFWTSGSTIDQSRLPIFDDDIESIADGTVVRAGVRHTWQTMRGPATRQRSVDWLTLNTDVVWSTGEVDEETPYGRFIEARPELSNLGRFLVNDVVWNMTDAVTIASNWLYNTQEGETARTTLGAIIDHGDGFWSFVEYRDLDAIDATRLNFGAGYELTTKYALTAEFIYDLDEDDLQSFQTRVARRFPQWTVEMGFDFDDVADSVGIGILVRPVGLGGETRTHRFTDFGAGVIDQGPSRPAVTPGRFRSGPLAE